MGKISAAEWEESHDQRAGFYQDPVFAGAQSGLPGGRLLKKGNVTVMGYPALEHQNFARPSAVYKNLPEMFKELNELRRELNELKANLENKD